MKRLGSRLTYANVMSSLAVFLVLGGATAFATTQIHLGKNSVGSKQLKRNAVTASKIKRNAITGTKIKKNAVTGSKINLSTLGTVPSAAVAATFNGFQRIGLIRAGATAGATEATAREAAPKVSLFSAGPFSFYAKCFTFGTTVRAEVFVSTTVNGAVFSGEEGSLDGAPKFLNTASSETERGVAFESTTGAATANLLSGDVTGFYAFGPEGTSVHGDALIAVRNGALPEGDGVYGAGNSCVFSGTLTQLS